MLLRLVQWPLWVFSRFVLSLRYRARVVGQAEVFRQPGPYLVLPNHPAYADPPNILVTFWGAFRFRPMLLETNFRNPLLAPFAWVMRAIKVPDLDRASTESRQRAEAAVAEAIAALKAGDNVLLWPSGRLMRDGIEHVGGARAVSDILAAVPEATAVLVRTRGMWGSSFSWAYDGTRPPFFRRLVLGPVQMLANLVLFMPRRRLTFTLEGFPAARRPPATREALNHWLEEWYNADVKPEPPTFVPQHFLFGPRTHEFPPPPAAVPVVDVSRVKPATKQAVAEILGEALKRPLEPSENRAEATFQDLGIDSLELMEVVLDVERRFGFSGDALPATVGQLWALAEGQVEKGPPKPPPAKWFTPPTGSLTVEVLGETIPEAICFRMLRHRYDVALADDTSGVLTYERFLLASIILSKRFRKIPGDAVGLLIPASAGGMIALVALHFAGKLPVILNWTTGPGSMAHGVGLTKVTHVVTSRRFIDRAHVEVPGTTFVFLEDVRGTVGKWEMVRRMLGIRFFPARTARRALSRIVKDPQAPAVVLFTSGSEKAPKAVPLTHANILGDLRGAAPILHVDRTHTLLVFLPLFHSFGHTITGLFPLIVGLKAVYHPDPTDAGGLVRKVGAYKATAVATTPTFFGYMLEKAQPGDLASLRVVVVGAEKCPAGLFAQTAKLAPHAVVMEGYGVTECSPCVSVNPSDAPKPGTIGKPLVGIDVCVTDLETGAVLPTGSMGMLHVSGPIVFPGYLGHDGPQPFAEFGGKKWYVTGDLAELGEDGYLRFHGRLKRFLKAGGEMISLPALEEPFAKKYPPTEDGPRVAVEGIETDGGRRVVLFATFDLPLREANAVLTAEGFRGVLRLDEVMRVEKIPVLGTGKTDYKVLRAMLG